MALTPKQERFVAEYLVDGNATRAAIAAGYSPKTAKEQGCRLFTNVNVKAAVEAGQKAALKRAELSADMVRNRLRQILNFDVRKLYDENGNLRPVMDLDDDTAAAVNGIEVVVERRRDAKGDDANTVTQTHRVKTVDVARAVELGMRHFGLGKDVHEHTGKDGGPIELSDFERARRIAFILAKAKHEMDGN